MTTTEQPAKPGLLRRALRLIAILAVLYALACLGARWLSTKLLFPAPPPTYGETLPGLVMINDVRVIRAMTLAGEGVALLPAYLCRAECAAGSLQRLLPAWHAKADPVHLVYPRQRFMPPKLRAFIDLAGEVLAGCLE